MIKDLQTASKELRKQIIDDFYFVKMREIVERVSPEIESVLGTHWIQMKA